ncbi:MAG: exodeoxyribonuclease VII small subunit [Clostridia bacterium]|nr:exodeoxyribonuclease VII small subunit [Clostridia bacterium]
MAKNNMTLKEAMNELELTVNALEGELEIEKAMELYEKAMKLSMYCTRKISDAKQKITQFSRKDEDDE